MKNQKNPIFKSKNKLKLNPYKLYEFDKKFALPSVQNEAKKFRTVKTETQRPKLNEVLKNNFNPNLGIHPKSFRTFINYGDIRKIQNRNKSLNRESDENSNNNYLFKLDRKASSHQKYIDLENLEKKDPIIVLKKKIFELEKENEEKEKKINELEYELNNKEDEKYNIKDLLKKVEDLEKEKTNIEKENETKGLKIQEDQNEIELLKIKISKIEKENKELKENQEKINLLEIENTTKEEDKKKKKDKINIKDKFNEDIKFQNSNYRKMLITKELERKKNNLSIDLGKTRDSQDNLNLENKNDYNNLKSMDTCQFRLMDDKIKKKLLFEKNMKEAKNFKNNKIFFENENENYRKESSQKNKDSSKFLFNNKITKNNPEYKDNDTFNIGKNRKIFLDNKIMDKINGKMAVKINNYVKNKELNSSKNDKNLISIEKKDDERDSNKDNNLENVTIEKELKKEDLLNARKEEKENIKNINDEFDNSNNEKLKEMLKFNLEKIERLKKEKNDLKLKNKELKEEYEKMNDNNDLILKNKELNKEKETIKQKLEINNNELENIKNEKIELNNRINSLIIENKELKKEKEDIKDKLHKEKEILEKINKEKEEINNLLHKEKYNNELNKEKDINEEINNLKLENKELNKKIKEENIKYNNLNNNNIELNKKYESIKFELKNGVNEKNNLIKEKEKLNEENTINKLQIKKYYKENNELILKKNELEKQLNELKLLFEQNQKQNEIFIEVMNNNPIALYLKPTLIGLNNIGATCFMNSTLQCLSQTKELTNYFLKQKNKNQIINNNIALKSKNNYQLSPIFLELIQNLWDRNGSKSFSPNKFMNIVNEINPLFKTGQAGDAKDFIIFVLEQLHKELRKSINSNSNSNLEQLNQYDSNNALNYFFKDFKNQVSIISDIFYGFNETTNECLNCKSIYNFKGLSNNPICYNYGIFNCLIFPLEEIKNFKNNNNYNFQINNNCVSIYDCFKYNQKTEIFTGENKNYCNICKQLYDSYYTSKIYICPTVLILILNRGKGNIYNIKLFFDEIIDITEYTLKKDKSKIIYNLYGVITHIGESGPNAHFIASCKSPIDKKWYRYNDSIVNQIENVQKEIIEFGTPYILFYHKQDF